jgi:hypothetical protein
MQIAPGQTPLSLAILKALGSQTAPAAKAAAGAAGAAPSAKVSAPTVGGETAGARSLPRGSFVDLRV